MCGIFGYVGYIEKSLALKCRDMIAHRGPDGYGLVQFDDVTLAHRRLSIIDLSEKALQPMSYANERYWITYNGEIYNFKELRQELTAHGFQFKSNSDTEVILAAFQKWGEDCQKKFNGMWSFAIWDVLTKRLFLSRDRFGKKPLFYKLFQNGDIAFCSEMKGLFPLMSRIQPNREVVGNTSKYMEYESTQECAIEGIMRFPAGSCGWFIEGKIYIKQWWNTLENLIDTPKNYHEQVDLFKELFFDACKLRMRSDVPIGTALSGGLDSSVTFSCMAELGSKNLIASNSSWQHAFVASFPGSPLDEVEYAQEVASRYSVDPVIVEIDPLEDLDAFYDYIYLQEDPYITSPIPFMKLYEAVKKNGVSVTLDGHGADELFGGYAFDIIHALYDCTTGSHKYKEVIQTYYRMHGSSEQLSPTSSKIGFLCRWQAKKALRHLRGISNPSGPFDSLNSKLYESTHKTVLPTLLRNYDRYSMANGVEIRMPFLDHRIVSFAFSIPWTSKVRGGYSKAIVRDALGNYIPKRVARRAEKIGFNSPVVEWMKGPLKNFLLEAISENSFNESTLIDPKEVRKSILDVIGTDSPKFQNAVSAWTKLTPYLWEKAISRKVSRL
jgi:asparagine synthase (glutamine-hydrolysing)